MNKGFTLIETMVALGILVFVLTGMVSLIILNITNAKNIEKNLIAGNLAQEALEVVRSMRDNDWLEGNNFGDFIPVSGNEYSVQWNDTDLNRGLVTQPLNFDETTGIYSYDNGELTIYSRKVLIDQVTDKEIKVLVTVEWILRSGPAQLQAESHLFDWY
jgi:type II secretory pathway pseudopilin PulG